MERDASRFVALWDRMETLATAFLESFWREAPGNPEGEVATPGGTTEIVEPRKGRSGAAVSRARAEEPSSAPGPPVDSFEALYPPETARPARPGPTLKDLGAAIACLRRIQDARYALDRKSMGEEANEKDGNAVDFVDLLGAVSETVKRGAAGAEESVDEDSLCD